MADHGKILFRLDANTGVGFGHASRCAKISRRLIAAGFECLFVGDISDASKHAIRKQCANVSFADTSYAGRYNVCVMDLMADSENPEAVDKVEVERWRHSGKMVYIHSGLTIPELASDILTIGYHPSAAQPIPSNVRWGVEYAPIDHSEIPADLGGGEKSGALVALGGAPDWSIHQRTVAVLSREMPDQRIDVLGSPVIPGKPTFSGCEDHVQFHIGVPTVYPLIRRAEVVVASFGNLCYEAMHIGAKLIVLGQKQFQIECGNLLAANGYCISAGGGAGLEAGLSGAVHTLQTMGEQFYRAGQAAFDGRGIERIAHLIASTAAR